MTRERSQARRALLRRLIAAGTVTSQEHAGRLLARRGHRVTQTTVSRDLAAIGAEKRAGENGECYTLRNGRGGTLPPGHADVVRIMREFVVGVAHSGNLALLRTAPGAASPVASAIDGSPPKGILGTIAGDDTVLVVSSTANGGAGVARRLEKVLEEIES